LKCDDRGSGVVRGALMDGSTVILGIEIPSTNPVFLGIIAIHIPLGLGRSVAGMSE
jgi:hypothetical protein